MIADLHEAPVLELNETILETDVSFEDYLERYAADFCEWVGGTVVKMSPIHERHDELTRYFTHLVAAYFELRPIGQLRISPFVMRLPETRRGREPDLQIILNSNPHPLRPTYMDGPADIAIEVISPGTEQVDRETKLLEYQAAGVKEYWWFDSMARDARFFRLGADGVFVRQQPDADGNYRTMLLPGLALEVALLWRTPLPGPGATFNAVKAMLGETG
jgi:Uma2 family endonuclease